MLPEERRPNTAENRLRLRIDLFDEPGDIDAAPAICVKDGKAHDIRLISFEATPDVRLYTEIVIGVENVNRIAVGAKHGTYEIETHGYGADIFLIDTIVNKLWIDE